ncbi:T9SS type A sorting domain-containing protein [Seonamhaeicola sp.]|uniref:T9SS type A sorting domain-containing protein n=1 Tax=Seonamhaeicola sp. TaxID=1912245 RepID=UPI002613A771|nr:T9SS type A sorting domain-containing protein [Seonamhaeicola sp.]
MINLGSKLRFSTFLFFIFATQTSISQVLLDADGAGNTYELITSVLAPGYNPIEVPDCEHGAFGRHIDEVYDSDLGSNVFRFYMHVTDDSDRCINYDRQRNEIKSYDKSPDNLLGIEDEIVVYKWKFKIDAGFQSSSSFTHLHQLKSVGGSLASMPMYTLTTRKGSPDQLELRYAETTSQVTLTKTDLAPFKGIWLDVTETITYGTSGTYSLEIKKVSDGTVLFDYSNNSIINWRAGADFVRPKWGIYRSLNSPSDLRDEAVLFANFSIEEVSGLSTIDNKNQSLKLYPNPTNDYLFIEHTNGLHFNHITIYDITGKAVLSLKDSNNIDVSRLPNGFYFISLKTQNDLVFRKRFIKN